MYETKFNINKFMLKAVATAAVLVLLLVVLIAGSFIGGSIGGMVMIMTSSAIIFISLAFSGYGFYVQNELKNQF